MNLILSLLLILLPISAGASAPMSYVERVKDAWDRLDANNLQVVDEFYDENLEFHDPVGSLKGRAKMKAYYQGLYKDLKSIKFEYLEFVTAEKSVAMTWRMTYATEKLNGGAPIVVDGMSLMKFGGPEDKVVYHRDYFDIGTMVYEHIPVLGWGVRKVRERLGSHE